MILSNTLFSLLLYNWIHCDLSLAAAIFKYEQGTMLNIYVCTEVSMKGYLFNMHVGYNRDQALVVKSLELIYRT